MTWVAGVDGCRNGWVVVDALVEKGRIIDFEERQAGDLDEILEGGRQPREVALDMPVGLLEERVAGGRECDRQTRKNLGRRASSVFSPPIRPLLGAKSWSEVRGKGLSIQAFHILPKIALVDAWITPVRQRRVYEAHPELAFARLAGHPLRHNKKRGPGRAERLALLAAIFPNAVSWAAKRPFPRKEVAADDLLDAAVMAWVARCHLLGLADCLPATRPLDARGLEMVIWAPEIR